MHKAYDNWNSSVLRCCLKYTKEYVTVAVLVRDYSTQQTQQW